MIDVPFLPADFPHPGAAALLLVISFLGSATTAAFSIGGGLLVIAAMSTVMPAAAVIPVHGAVMLGSNLGRAGLLREGIDWRRVGWFALGGLVGGAIGAQLVLTLPDAALRLAIAGFILFTQWGPKLVLPLGRGSFVAAGGISMVLTLFVGASGPFITALLAKVPSFSRIQLIATGGACMAVQHGFKVAIFALAGFAYWAWMPFIAAAIVTGFAGTFLGAKALRRLNEQRFRSVLKWILTAMAAYLTALALHGLFAA